jgi:tetratricopeptide (TPR) repeat protein
MNQYIGGYMENCDHLLAQAADYIASGDWEAVVKISRKILSAEPDNIKATKYLCRALLVTGHGETAINHLDSIISKNSKDDEFLSLRGNISNYLGNQDEAEKFYRAALSYNQNNTVALINLGNIFRSAGDYKQSIQYTRQAYALNPGNHDLLTSLYQDYIYLEKFDELEKLLVENLEKNRESAFHNYMLGRFYRHIGRPYDSIRNLEHALEMDSQHLDTYIELGKAYRDSHNIDKAMKVFTACEEIAPGNILVQWQKSLTYLSNNDFEKGWSGYSARFLRKQHIDMFPEIPLWHGDDISEKRIIVYQEQGIGDEIMFSSCISDLVKKAGKVILHPSNKLYKIFKCSFPEVELCMDEPGCREAKADIRCSIGDLPGYFRTNTEDFLNKAPYLNIRSNDTDRWQKRLAELGDSFKVGICWRGGTPESRRHLRSISLEQLLPVLTTDNCHFINLQYFDVRAETNDLSDKHNVQLCSYPEVLESYYETAALVSSLDLIISVQGALLHLSGAMGKPVWGLIPFSAEWRYGHSGRSMLWYPSAVLYRQQHPLNWEGVIQTVSIELARLVAEST